MSAERVICNPHNVFGQASVFKKNLIMNSTSIQVQEMKEYTE